MKFVTLVECSHDVTLTSARTEKINRLASCLRAAAPQEVALAIAYLMGEPRQRKLGVGWSALRNLVESAEESSLSVKDVDRAFTELESEGGPGSGERRRTILTALLARATPEEQEFLRRLMSGELRQGAQQGLLAEAVAVAADVPAAKVRRAAMLLGDLSAVGQVAIVDGEAGLERVSMMVGRGVEPMLAQSAASLESALEKITPAYIEWKLDGVRVQAHRRGGAVKVFTRSLDDVTPRMPEVVHALQDMAVESIILDGEVIALQQDGRPRLFQETASRASSGRQGKAAEPLVLTPFFFDVLHVNGRDLIDLPLSERVAVGMSLLPEGMWVPRIQTSDLSEADAFLKAALAQGHEGVMIKSPSAAYEAGRRGSGWIKVKPRHTLDLVILAAEWGHGRRTGWLSNLHLAARGDEEGQYVMLGKTFKGLTDEMLRWQTERLLQLEERRTEWTVYVRPELIAEIAFDGIQRSSRYPGGMALRFARVLRYREDKRVEEADTLAAVRQLASN